MALLKFEAHLNISVYEQYITIWVEENGSLASGTYEYSFGDGMVGKWAGYTVLTPSKVLKMGISVSSRVDPVDVGVSHLSLRGRTV